MGDPIEALDHLRLRAFRPYADLEDAMGIVADELDKAAPGSLCWTNVLHLRAMCRSYLRRTKRERI